MKQLAGWAAAAALGLVATWVTPAPAAAQGYFGQNQVQYDRLDWRVLETEHFLVHYYPEEKIAVQDAARMAERSYARLSRLLNHQFREKKPLVLFVSRTDFAQNNVTGDLGEGTGGVTDLARQRNMLPFTGDYRSFEHVLTHEMVHQFQYDIFARGRAGTNVQQFAQVNPPLWFMEGMAEYLSLGPDYPITNATMRDAALNGRVPTIKQLEERPDQFFPYSYGEALWAYVGQRWGDDIVGRIMDAVPSSGVERAFRRETGMSLEDLGEEWREAVQTRWLPQVAQLERARKIAQPLLSEKRSGGQVFVAPTLSDDGRYIAFLSNGRFLRGEISIDLYLADARTGKRIGRLTNTLTSANTEELRLLYSQSNFSPDARYLAFVAQRKGKDVLNILDVRRRKTIRTIDRGFEQLTGPAWSPDGRRIVFSASKTGISDLFVIDVDGKNLQQLTDDKYGDLQPAWSPDGSTIAFVSDRGPGTDFSVLRFAKWQLSTLDVATKRVDVLPNQGGLNINPQWAPDGRSLAFVSDRSGTANLFLYDFESRDHFQLTNLVGTVGGFSEYSPAITWARKADRLAFTYLENDDYTVWSVDNPRLLRRAPYRGPPTPAATLAQAITTQMTGSSALSAQTAAPFQPGSAGANRPSDATGPDTIPGVRRDTTVATGVPRVPGAMLPRDTGATTTRSFYRGTAGVRASSELPVGARGDTSVVSVAALLDSATLALPDTNRFKDYKYGAKLQPDYIAQPSVGVGTDNFGRGGVLGGTTIVLSDLLGNAQLALSGQVNGRFSDAQIFSSYTRLGRRLQYNLSALQTPYYFAAGSSFDSVGLPEGLFNEQQGIARYLIRQVGATGLYPLNRFTRFEFGATFNNIDRSLLNVTRVIDQSGIPLTGFQTDGQFRNIESFNYAQPFVAFVSDNTLSGITASPLIGRRMRFDIAPSLGSFQLVEYNADYRRYDPILFNFLTVATRFQASIGMGRDELTFPKYIGNPQFIRGYDRQNFGTGCSGGVFGGNNFGCNETALLGSRVALTNLELRFPLIRRLDLGLLPISLPPLEGLVFYDAGVAWSRAQNVNFRRAPEVYDPNTQRYLLTSYGAGLRLNLFGFAIVRWDYAIPLDRADKKGFWTWSLGPSF